MKKLVKILSVFSFSMLIFSCTTTSELTDILSIASGISSSLGNDKTAAVLNATTSVSKALEDFTPENEYYIGRSLAATILTNYSVYENKEAEIYLNKICNTLAKFSTQAEPFNGYHVKILNSSEKNAFATSGGHIFITKGLLECINTEDELAAVIAHEMSHIQLKHSLKAIKASRWTEAGFTISNTANSGNNEKKQMSEKEKNNELSKTMNAIMEDIITDLINSGYSKTQEFDADINALQIMNDAGYNPVQFIDMLNLLETNQHEETTGIYKTHPQPTERISNVKIQLRKTGLTKDTSIYREPRFSKIKF